MLLTKAFARRILAISPLVAGASFLALAALTPSTAMAQRTLTIYHNFVPPFAGTDPSVNPFNSSHTVVGQLSGVCAEPVGEFDGDGEGDACLVDSDCPDSAGDEFCDLSGVPGVAVGFRILGQNAQDISRTTDSSGQASMTYSDVNGPGTDTIQACADFDTPETITACLTDSEPGDDIPSNTLTKDWVPTVVLNPPGAFNLPGATSTHTVTATLNGVMGFCNGGIPTACTSDIACLGDGACDFSGYLLGIKVTSGPNLGGLHTDTGLVSTDSKGQVTMLYSDLGGPGTDLIQACADLGEGGPDDGGDVGTCLSDNEPLEDIASNVAPKVWSAKNLALTPLIAFNPIGVPHVVTATSAGIGKRCAAAQGFGPCTSDLQCSNVVGSCSLAGYPVFFAVVGTCTGGNNGGATCVSNSDCNSNVCSGGPNLGQNTTGVTDANGVTTGTFNSVLEGQDRIQACLDGDPSSFGVTDDTGLIECINDFNEGDVPGNTVVKNWFANFVTGGGGVNVGSGAKKKNLQGSGIVGKAGLAGIQGDWQAVSQISGKTVACHFNTFTSIAFSGPPATKPPSSHNTATFTTGPGKCNDGSSPILTVTIVDLGEGNKVPRDTLNIVSSDSRFSTGGTLPLVTGNYQVHSITP